MPIAPTEVRFIKLGRGGMWELDCIEGPEPTIRFGFDNPHHQACSKGNWGQLDTYWKEKKPGEATKILNQTKDFYKLDQSTLWITFYKRKLYWCFADSQVVEIELGGSRSRKAINGWCCTDLSGDPLFSDSLSGRLTKTQGFRGTICRVKEQDYLISRINCVALEDVQKAKDALAGLKNKVIPLIQRLNWRDFELLVDLIFARSGWQRLSALGKTEKSIDLELLLPVTGRRAFVQVKSQADLRELQEYIAEFRAMEQFQEMFFIVHTALDDLQSQATLDGITLWGISEIASLVVDSGLSQWLIQKTS
jgi:Restriction endonuclease